MKTLCTKISSNHSNTWKIALTLLFVAFASANALAATTNVNLVSITVSPSTLTASVGSSEQFTATGHYSDGSTSDLTSSVTWSSSVPSVATVSSTGLATVLAGGNTTILAGIAGAAAIDSQVASPVIPPAKVSASPVSSQLPNGLVLHWTFDAATISGNTVTDLSGSNLNGTINGNVAIVSGQNGEALKFNGINASVQNYTAAPLNSDLTLSAWINTTNAARSEAIIARYNAAGPGTGYIFRTDGNGHLEVVFGGYNGGSINSPMVDTATINDGQWHHVVAVIMIGKGVQFYVDGYPTANIPAQINALDNGGIFNVGQNSYTPFGNYFTGIIDEVQIYNRALAASEVATVYALSQTQTSTQNQAASTPATSTAKPQASSLQNVSTATLGQITASPTSLSFGNVTIGASASQTIALSNSGGSGVTISNVSISGPGFGASGLPVGTVLTPGQSVPLNVSFTPSGTGAASGGVTLTSNSGSSTLLIALSGVGVQPAPASFSVNLTWAPSTSTGIAGYKIYRGTSATGPLVLLTSNLVTSDGYIDPTAQPGQTYYYAVTAVSSSGVESAFSNDAAAIVP